MKGLPNAVALFLLAAGCVASEAIAQKKPSDSDPVPAVTWSGSPIYPVIAAIVEPERFQNGVAKLTGVLTEGLNGSVWLFTDKASAQKLVPGYGLELVVSNADVVHGLKIDPDIFGEFALVIGAVAVNDRPDGRVWVIRNIDEISSLELPRPLMPASSKPER